MTDDKLLVKKILEGDMEAFRQLIKNYERLVVHMVSKVVSDKYAQEEICQDVFLKVYDNIGSFNFKSKLSTWIGTIAYRLSINYIKKKRLQLEEPEVAEKRIQQYYIDNGTPEKIASDKDFSDFVQQAVDMLPVQYKVVLTLYHMEGMSYPEIEEVTGQPLGTIKNYLFRARKLLKDKLCLVFTEEELL